MILLFILVALLAQNEGIFKALVVILLLQLVLN